MGSYVNLDHTADLAIQVKAEDISDLIRTAADAWRDIVFENQTIVPLEQERIEIKGETAEEILVECLSEFNYLSQIKGKIFHSYEQLTVSESKKQLNLKAVINVDRFDVKRHQTVVEIKAVTFHQLDIQKVNKHLQTVIVFDI